MRDCLLKDAITAWAFSSALFIAQFFCALLPSVYPLAVFGLAILHLLAMLTLLHTLEAEWVSLI